MTACRRRQFISSLGVLVFIALIAATSPADDDIKLSKGQTVYVPVYSHIYSGPRSTPIELTGTLSIRNTDSVSTIGNPFRGVFVLDIRGSNKG